jgi:hypothetical protein
MAGKVMQHANGLQVRAWNGSPIERRESDGFVNATAMCKAAGKLWGHYWANARTKEYVKALGTVIGNPITVDDGSAGNLLDPGSDAETSTDLIQTVQGGPAHLQGTWIDPRLAIDLARWCSPEFAVWMDSWFIDWMLSRQQASQPATPPPATSQHPIPLEQLPPGLAAAYRIVHAAYTLEAEPCEQALTTLDDATAALRTQYIAATTKRKPRALIAPASTFNPRHPKPGCQLELMASIHGYAKGVPGGVWWSQLARHLFTTLPRPTVRQGALAIQELARRGYGRVLVGPKGGLGYKAHFHA